MTRSQTWPVDVEVTVQPADTNTPDTATGAQLGAGELEDPPGAKHGTVTHPKMIIESPVLAGR